MMSSNHSTRLELQERLDRAARVEEAATRAVELVQHYSDIDPYNDDPNNPWRDPNAIFKALNQARQELVDAWGSPVDDKKGHHVPRKGSDENFRAVYIAMITDAFAEELEHMRKDEEVDVDILVDCLQSGMDLLNNQEKLLLEQEHTNSKDKGRLTPHEIRQRQLGFHF